MKRIINLLLLIVVFNLHSVAQHRSVNDAMEIARKFFMGEEAKSRSMTNQSALKLTLVPPSSVLDKIGRKNVLTRGFVNQDSPFYIFNDEANNSFVIVSSDKRLQELLGYSYNGAFDVNNVPDGLLYMMDCYNREYEELLAGNIEVSSSHKKVYSYRIDPLITTTWNQTSPYNDFCPADPYGEANNRYGGKCYTGCVATAMAQVMNYHKWPKSSGQGKVSYSTKSLKIGQNMDFSNVTFDWDNMKNNYKSSYSAAQKKAVATLMHACGIASLMDYQGYPKGSGAYSIDMAYALINYFNYNQNLKFYEKKYFSEEEWDSIIIDNLSRNMPIVYAGNNGDSGHEFLLTGYNGNGLYWFNWGWGGSYDGYFPLSSLKPGTNHNYSLGQEMTCYITKETFGDYEDGIFASEFVLDDTKKENDVVGSFSNMEWINAKVNSCNWTNYYETSIYDGKICVGLFDLDFNLIKELTSKTVHWKSGTYYPNFPFSIQYDEGVFYEGSQYYIAPYSSSADSKISFIRTQNGSTNYYLAKVKNGTVHFIPRGIPDIKPLPTPKPLEGTYVCSALNPSNEVVEWNVSLSRDGIDTLKYWFSMIDPTAITYGCKNSENRVCGFLNKLGNIMIPRNQSLGGQCLLNNFSSVDSIKVFVSAKDSIMTIEDVWGLVNFNENGEKSSLSLWSSTTFRYKAPDDGSVETPIIVVDNKQQMTISCPTIGADIYYTYTQEGATPSVSSTFYNSSIQLTENGIIKAIAIKNGRSSDVATEKVDVFVVATPVITAPYHNNIVSIKCSTPNSTIYYTTDGTDPSPSDGNKYSGEFSCNASTIIKAIAIRENWRMSVVAEYSHVAITEFEINNIIAGNIPNRLLETDKMFVTKLKISGKVNGTDIKYIREMLQNGNLAYLDLKDADIVSGGEAYCYSGDSPIYTEDNYVDDYMFWNMSRLKTLDLPKSTKRISGIRGCDNLTQIIVPDGCETVERINGAKLEYIYIPKSVTYIRLLWGGIGPCFKAFDVDPNNPSYKSIDGVLYSKDESVLMKYPQCISGSYTISENTETISDYAFEDAMLSSIMIPSSVKSIGDGAFRGCKQLNSVVVPNSVRTVGSFAFEDCVNLETVILSDKQEILQYKTFSGCIKLKAITIGTSLNSIGVDAFAKLNSLQAIYVSEQNASYASSNCVLYSKDLKTIVRYPSGKYSQSFAVPDNVEVIGDYAFANCSKIQEILLPNSVKKIGEYAFSGCTIKSIVFPASVEVISRFAFENCKEIESLIFPQSIKYLGACAITGCDKLAYVYLPETIETMYYGNISNCPSLEIINSDLININTIFVDHYPVVHEGIIEWFPLGIFDDPSYNMEDIWGSREYTVTNSLNLSSENSETIKWLIPFGCSENYASTCWWKSTYSIEEKAQEGDANANGEIDVTDIVEMVDYILDKPSDGFLFDTSDLNKDGEVDVTDIKLTIPLVMSANLLRNVDDQQKSNDQLVVVNKNESSIALLLNNKTDYIASQFDIITSPDQRINDIHLNVERSSGHDLYYKQIDDNRYRVIIYSLANHSFLKTAGDLVEIELNDSRSQIRMENIEFITQDKEMCILDVVDRFLPDMSNASDENPVECTGVIKSPNFENADMKSTSEGWINPGNLGNDDEQRSALAMEFWQTRFDMYQTIFGLPEGTYKLTVDAWVRMGGNEETYKAWNNDPNVTMAYAYAVDGNSTVYAAPVANLMKAGDNLSGSAEFIVSEEEVYYMPNTLVEGRDVIEQNEGLFTTEVICKVLEDGVLTVGIKKDKPKHFSWVVLDNFRLFYHGSNSSLAPSGSATAINDVKSQPNADSGAIYSISGQRLDVPKKGVNIIGGKKVVIK